MTEVTWHSNKHNQYLRGDKISSSLYSKNWLYHNGWAVRCDRWMEVAALVLSINPSIDGETQSRELASVQLQLLDYLYKKQYLNKYPIAICSYCELLECFPDHNKHYDVITLYDEAVSINHNEYSDHHVLVHCSKAYHCIRQRRYSDALKCFAGAATSLAKYNHMKGDDEIYKEIIEIANETIPQLFRDCPILFSSKDCFHDLVRFYDGVCSWEEGSQTPVIGTPMARNFVTIVNSFHIEIRENFAEEEEDQTNSSKGSFDDDFQPTPPHSPYESGGHCHGKLKLTVCSGKMLDLKRSLTHREKINQSAACLLLTALSHTTVPKRERRKGEYDVTYNTNNRKRKRER